MKITGIVGACVASALIAGAIVYLLDRPTAPTSPKIGKGGLEMCRAGDNRLPVPVWSPKLTEKGDLTEEPPQNDGQVVYIEIFGDNSRFGCAAASSDKLYSVSKPNNPETALEGGLAVNLRGNVNFHNGFCTFRGFFMNERVPGLHQGWTETYFGAVDRFDLIKSNRYCATAQEKL